jgi:hypothetical protein
VHQQPQPQTFHRHAFLLRRSSNRPLHLQCHIRCALRQSPRRDRSPQSHLPSRQCRRGVYQLCCSRSSDCDRDRPVCHHCNWGTCSSHRRHCNCNSDQHSNSVLDSPLSCRTSSRRFFLPSSQ